MKHFFILFLTMFLLTNLNAQIVESLTTVYSVYEALQEYDKEKRKGIEDRKQFELIVDKLNECSKKIDKVYYRINALGGEIDSSIRVRFTEMFRNQLLSTFKKYELHILPTNPPEYNKEKAMEILTSLHDQSDMLQRYGIAEIYSIGSAMILHHNTFYLTNTPIQVQSNQFQDYENYFKKVIEEVDRILPMHTSGEIGTQKYYLRHQGYDGEVASLPSNHYNFDIVFMDGRYKVKDFNKGYIAGENKFLHKGINPNPVIIEGQCVNGIKEKVEKRTSEDKDEVRKYISISLNKVNACVAEVNSKIKDLQNIRSIAVDFKLKANRWATNPTLDTKALDSIKF